MSALPLKADMLSVGIDVYLVPEADMTRVLYLVRRHRGEPHSSNPAT